MVFNRKNLWFYRHLILNSLVMMFFKGVTDESAE